MKFFLAFRVVLVAIGRVLRWMFGDPGEDPQDPGSPKEFR